jgi:hypothetical protein
MAMYIPNMKPEQFYDLCKEHGLEIIAVPIPPHGDLIDREPFVQFIKTHWDSYDQWFVAQLEARPTIIPADPAEEDET